MLSEIETLFQPAAFDPATVQATVRIAATDYAYDGTRFSGATDHALARLG